MDDATAREYCASFGVVMFRSLMDRCNIRSRETGNRRYTWRRTDLDVAISTLPPRGSAEAEQALDETGKAPEAESVAAAIQRLNRERT